MKRFYRERIKEEGLENGKETSKKGGSFYKTCRRIREEYRQYRTSKFVLLPFRANQVERKGVSGEKQRVKREGWVPFEPLWQRKVKRERRRGPIPDELKVRRVFRRKPSWEQRTDRKKRDEADGVKRWKHKTAKFFIIVVIKLVLERDSRGREGRERQCAMTS